MSIVKQPPDGYGHEQSVELLTTNDIALELETKKNEFLWNELLAIYADSGLSRKYKKTSFSDWTKFSHVKALAGYSIHKYSLSDMAYNILNLLYMDGERLLENRGRATSEGLSSFDKVLLYNGDATPTFQDHTTEAGTEQGTPFLLMDSINDYLYIGADEKFSSLAFAFSVFGSGHNLKVEYYKEVGTPAWEELSVIDDTENFSSNGRISFTLPNDWLKCAVNSEATPNQYYYIRISTTSVPTIVAQAYSILPGDSVPTLLAMSRQQIQDREWCWCYFNEYVYMTIKNEGGGYYEGIDFIKDSSSDVNKENYFESNHNYKTIYEDENYTASAWAPEHIVVGSGTSFPDSPVLWQLFGRTDLDKWYIYRNGATPFWDEVKTGASAGDMLKSVYDINLNGVVDNSEKLEDSTKVQVQDHTPKAHTLDSHSEKKLDTLDEKTPDTGVTVDTCLIKDGKVADSNKLEASSKAQVQDHTAKAHNLGGSGHDVDTLANLNAKISDANLDDERILTFFIPTTDITAGTNKSYEIPVPFNAGLTILKVYIHCKQGPGEGEATPTDYTVTADVNKNGTTIFTTQENRPSIVGTTKSDESGTPDVTALAKNDILSVDVDVATAGHSATDMTIEVRCKIA